MTKEIWRIYRGYCWRYGAWLCRVALRNVDAPGTRYLIIGFRPAFRLKKKKR